MRVTGGELVGRTLAVPAASVRPTADRVRESLFMILSPELPGCEVLDLYAGSGALGIEALSRGAKHCLFVEADRRVAKVIGENLDRLGLGSRAAVAVAPVERWLERADGRTFDLILMDPPYRAPGIAAVLAVIARTARIRLGGLLVLEHDRRLEVPTAGYELRDRRRYGDTMVSFLTPAAGAPAFPGGSAP
jgi:16S rRNA (guanine966-N2)-methyltransferase